MKIELTKKQHFICIKRTVYKSKTIREFLDGEHLYSIFYKSFIEKYGEEEFKKMKEEYKNFFDKNISNTNKEIKKKITPLKKDSNIQVAHYDD